MGFLDGGIAKLVADALVGADMTKPAVLTKVTPGTRTPGSVSSGTNPTTADFTCRGIVQDLAGFVASGTLIADVSRVVRIFGATIASGAVPVPGDRITIEGTTTTIVGESGAITRDAAAATYVCQTR